MKKQSKHLIPNILTLFNMFIGFLAIGLIINNQPVQAGIFILFSGMFDIFDGKIARLLGIESKFGIEFDSMADTVSFCVVPSVLIYSLYVDGLHPLLGGAMSFIPLMFGSIRLAKFNIEQEFGNKKSYTVGLTTPIATITLFFIITLTLIGEWFFRFFFRKKQPSPFKANPAKASTTSIREPLKAEV